MIRTRKKSIALFVTLIFVLGLMLPVSAFASTTYADFTSSYSFTTTGDNKEITGTAKVTEKAAATWDDTIYVKLTLPTGATFVKDPKDGTATNYFTLTNATATIEDSSKSMILLKLAGLAAGTVSAVEFKFNVTGESRLDIASGVSGDIKATVEVFRTTATAIAWSESDTRTIAKVAETGATVKAAAAKTVKAGNLNVAGADVTVEEALAKAIGAAEKITMRVLTSGVSINAASTAPVSNVSGAVPTVTVATSSIEVDMNGAQSTVLPGKIVFKPRLDVAPNVTGDIEVEVYSNTAGSKVKTTRLVIAKVGEVSGDVDKLKDNDGICYIGKTKTFGASFDLKAVSGTQFEANKVITLTLSDGKWGAGTAAADITAVGATWRGIYNDDKTIWLTITAATDKLSFSSFAVKAGGGVKPGAAALTIGGTAGVSGEVVIGQYASQFSISAEKPAVKLEALAQSAGNITIQEYTGGVFTGGRKIFLKLPAGVTFNGVPTVKRTGAGALGTIAVVENNSVLEIPITTASGGTGMTITISDIKYDMSRLALTGDVELTVLGEGAAPLNNSINAVDNKPLGKVANATASDAKAVTATFAVGDAGVAVKSGRTLVQVNLLCDVLGLQKSWDAATKTAYFVKDGKVVAFPMGENAIYINGVKVPVDQGGVIVSDFTYATLCGIQMAFGGELDWNNDTKTATFKFTK
ncbi:MAG: copper amine oxidase N-terminal domain-containing protein [Bacillota bacterium]